MVSPVLTEDMPVTLKVVTLSEILNSNSVVIGVKAIGDWTTPSIDNNAFSFFLNISNSWLLPEPKPENVNAIPARASALVFATWKVSLNFLIANSSVPDANAPPAVVIPDTDAPVKVEPGE